MSQIFAKLPGLDREKMLALVEPILRAHGVSGVELVWRTDTKGHVLELTVERPDSQTPGAGVTIDVCSELSRDLSAALDVSDVIASARYRLEVGSPGLDRALHFADDYRRFAGQLARVKLSEPLDEDGFIGQKVIRGTLMGLDESGECIVLQTDGGELTLPLSGIASARLVFQWKSPSNNSGRKERPTRGKTSRSKRSK